jgi:hypothetical protein
VRTAPSAALDMAQVKRTFERLLQIKERQWTQRWGAEYVAGTFSDAIEAPGISSATTLRPLKLGCRRFHTLSEPETFASLLALYHPDSWDIHEQFVMFPKAKAHPLYGHPRSKGATFKPLPGTLEVAERLNILAKHPRVRLKIGDDPMQWPMAPFPFLGDLRLFMQDAEGPYCLNWTVKDKYDDFKHRGPRGKPRPKDDLVDPSSVARHQLEEIYHSDAGIRTQQVSKDRIDFHLRCNLRDLFLEQDIRLPLVESHAVEALEFAQGFIGADLPMYQVAKQMAREFGFPDRDALTFIRQRIFRRDLRVDLFRPLLTPKPLRPEVDDALVRYAHWFQR